MNKSATPLASGQRFPPLRIGLNVPQVVVIPHTDIPLAKGLGNGLWHLRPGFDQFSPHLLHPRHHPLATAATLGVAMTSGLTLTFTASSTSRPAKSRCQAEVDGTHHLHWRDVGVLLPLPSQSQTDDEPYQREAAPENEAGKRFRPRLRGHDKGRDGISMAPWNV